MGWRSLKSKLVLWQEHQTFLHWFELGAIYGKKTWAYMKVDAWIRPKSDSQMSLERWLRK